MKCVEIDVLRVGKHKVPYVIVSDGRFEDVEFIIKDKKVYCWKVEW